jgi:hypothetical protein
MEDGLYKDQVYKYWSARNPLAMPSRKNVSTVSDPPAAKLESPRTKDAFTPKTLVDPVLDTESAQSSDSTYKPAEIYEQIGNDLDFALNRQLYPHYYDPLYYHNMTGTNVRKTANEEPLGGKDEAHHNSELDDDSASSSESSGLDSLDDEDGIQSDRKLLRNLFNEILETPQTTANPASPSATPAQTTPMIPKFLVFDGEPLRIFLSPDLDNYAYKRKWIARYGGKCVHWTDAPDLWIGTPSQPQAGEFVSEYWLNACFLARQLVDPKPYVVAEYIAVAASAAQTAERISRVLAGETDVERHAEEYTKDKLQWGYMSKSIEELDRMLERSRKLERERKKPVEGSKDSPIELDSSDEESYSEDDSEEESDTETEDESEESSSDEDEPSPPPAKRQKVRSGYTTGKDGKKAWVLEKKTRIRIFEDVVGRKDKSSSG